MPAELPRLRILMTTDMVGGVWDYSLELAANLGAQEIETVLVTMGPSPSPEQRARAAAAGIILIESDYKLEWMLGCEDDLLHAGAWLLGLEEIWRPDLIHLNGYAHATLPWKAPVLIVAHSCVLSWWRAVKGEAPPPEWDSYAQRVRRALASASEVVAPSRAMMVELQRHYGPLAKGRIIHNGRSPDAFSPLRKEDFIFCAGRLWDEGKNISALDAAAALGLDWPVLVAGSCQHPDSGKVAPAALGVLGRLGPDAMADYFGRARIYALPARYEPFGLTPLEAALAGCALVLGDIPSQRELWDEAALFVDPEDHRTLHRTLQQLIAEPVRCRELAAGARQRALGYSATVMTADYLECYQALLPNQDNVGYAKVGV